MSALLPHQRLALEVADLIDGAPPLGLRQVLADLDDAVLLQLRAALGGPPPANVRPLKPLALAADTPEPNGARRLLRAAR